MYDPQIGHNGPQNIDRTLANGATNGVKGYNGHDRSTNDHRMHDQSMTIMTALGLAICHTPVLPYK